MPYEDLVDSLAAWMAGKVSNEHLRRIYMHVDIKLMGERAWRTFKREAAETGTVRGRIRTQLQQALEEAVKYDPLFREKLQDLTHQDQPAESNLTVSQTGVSAIQIGAVQYFNTEPQKPERTEDEDDLTTRRQSFLFKFYEQAFKEASITFRMSIIAMALGATILLTAGIMTLLQPGPVGRDGVAFITALSGVLIGSCGGAFALHANRARKHLAHQAERMEHDLQADRKLAQTLRLIDEVEDPQLRDRLKSLTAMRVLSLEPDPESVTDHLLTQSDRADIKRVSPRRNNKDES